LSGENVEEEMLDCPYADACIRATREGIRRLTGRFEWPELLLSWATVEVITEEHFDYLLE